MNKEQLQAYLLDSDDSDQDPNYISENHKDKYSSGQCIVYFMEFKISILKLLLQCNVLRLRTIAIVYSNLYFVCLVYLSEFNIHIGCIFVINVIIILV